MAFYKSCRLCKYSISNRKTQTLACHRYPPQIWTNPKGESYQGYYETAPSACFPKVSNGDTCGEWSGKTVFIKLKAVLNIN